MNILVTGGAGYIGSIMTRQLLDAGHAVVVIDNLSAGHKDAVDRRAAFINSDVSDQTVLSNALMNHRVEAVMHFAGVISMAESMLNPGKYFQVNTQYSLNLLEAVRKNHIRHMIFSSTAGVYGNPEKLPIPEDHPYRPTNPYGESKLMVEQMLAWYDRIFELKYTALRYFNAAGASLDGRLGEQHIDETHLIPLAIKSAQTGTPLTLFGDDYPTPDGTCVRDYIHVEDLCRAHLLALDALVSGKKSSAYNVGTGTGHSNREVLAEIERVSGKKITVHTANRRPGDASELVADASKIMNDLGWKPKYSHLTTIIETAWKFHAS